MVTYGTTVNDLLCVSEQLQKEGILCDVIKLDQIQPLDLHAIIHSVRRTGRLLIAEECAANGCVGEAIAAALLQQGVLPDIKLQNLGDGVVPHGDLASLRSLCRLDAASIYETAKELLKNEA
jgi:1-deoxy-D-xylulose-5-phosphate synthase